jgi:glycosyltransferase involved in cell wall biosynthesis
MKILMQARINLLTAPGGDTVQILKTKEYLENLGIEVDLCIEISKNFNYEKYDIVHLFNVTRIQETYWFAKMAKKANKKVVLSTIFWDNTEVEKKADIGYRSIINKYLSINQIEYFKTLGRLVIQKEFNQSTFQLLKKGFRGLQKETIEYVDFFLPNAEIEMDLFHSFFSPKKHLPYEVIPNAVTIQDSPDNGFEEFKDCILCVGRIDPRKNQLNLVRALKHTNYKVVFVGQPAPNHTDYMKKIKKEATKNMYFLGWMDNSKISILYKQARVHVCPSWYETPGLASLEAAALGCNIVVTEPGSTREYFQNMAFYCEPDSIQSILNCVDLAFNSPISKDLQNKILTKYTWQEAAKKTLEAYKKLIN